MKKLVSSQLDVARALRVSKQTVSDWKNMGCPDLQSAPFEVVKIDRCVKANIGSKKITRMMSKDAIERSERKEEAITRIKEIQAENDAWHHALDCGELVPAKKWEMVLNRQAEVFKRELTNIENAADRLLGLNTRDKIAAALRTIINETLDRLYRGRI